ncbi:MAG: DegV family protein [Anaerolineae bacterium]
MSNLKTALITDSTCDIPDALVERYDIVVIPAYVIWGEEQFRDRVDLQPQEFYRRLQKDPVYPSSSHPTPGDFLELYRQVHEDGAEEIVVITVSSAMSGTYNAARQAGEMITLPVHVVDAKGPTMSLGWQVLAAARAREAGGGAEVMVAAAEDARSRMVQLVYMESIEYLHKGGRIGNAVNLLGTLLKIKPVVYIDHAKGVVEVETAVRTRRRGVETLYKGFFKRLDTTKPLHVAVLHGGVPEEAQALAARIREAFNPKELIINITGPVLGINTGPEALALAGYTEA